MGAYVIMKQLLILSGKGGTGKTTLASSFIQLSKTKQFADCDVEAPNLHLMQKAKAHVSKPYRGLAKAVINQDDCINCGLCMRHCRFNAINHSDGLYTVDPYKCEGCGVCGFVCPKEAIDFEQMIDGSVDLYEGDKRFSTGQLKMGSGNSGLLVTEVKRQLNEYDGLTIIDGPPGIGCPVIASISGVDFVLIVTEPSMSGFSDMKRMIQTIKKARVRHAVCINKYDINEEISKMIVTYLQHEDIDYVGHMEYSKRVSELINQGIAVIESKEKIADQIKRIYEKVMNLV